MPLTDSQLRTTLAEIASRVSAVEAELHRRGGPEFEEFEEAAHRLLDDLDVLADGVRKLLRKT
jgi:hypothetical protein